MTYYIRGTITQQKRAEEITILSSDSSDRFPAAARQGGWRVGAQPREPAAHLGAHRLERLVGVDDDAPLVHAVHLLVPVVQGLDVLQVDGLLAGAGALAYARQRGGGVAAQVDVQVGLPTVNQSFLMRPDSF